MISLEGNLNPNGSISIKFIHQDLRPNVFACGLIFLAGLAEGSWRDLAAVDLSSYRYRCMLCLRACPLMESGT
jgi:hypothetical protein